jgi:WD40 repeat protein
LNPAIELNVGSRVFSVKFSANSEYLLSGDEEGVGVWRVEDGRQIATMAVQHVERLAVSRDGRWIAAGTMSGDVLVWDAKTFKQAFEVRDSGNDDINWINELDFSPNSSQLVSASRRKATIWDIATRKRVQTLDHGGDIVQAAKYSPQSDRIATATHYAVRVWDSSDGHLLVNIMTNFNTSWRPIFDLLWFNNHLVISGRGIVQVEASTGSAVSQWPVPVSTIDDRSCMALPKHAEFIAHSTRRTVTFWDMATHTQLGLIKHSREIFSIAVSPDDRFLAIGGVDGKITINSLSRISVSILSSRTVAHVNNFLAPIIFL